VPRGASGTFASNRDASPHLICILALLCPTVGNTLATCSGLLISLPFSAKPQQGAGLLAPMRGSAGAADAGVARRAVIGVCSMPGLDHKDGLEGAVHQEPTASNQRPRKTVASRSLSEVLNESVALTR